MTLAQQLLAARLSGNCDWSLTVVGSDVDPQTGEESAIVILRCGNNQGQRFMVSGDRFKREQSR